MNDALDRRAFLRTTAGAAAALPLGCGSPPEPAVEPAQPNIVLIMSDDMGFSDLGCYGGEIETPVLDGLAKNGLRFRQFYNGARCCPTRASLLTGLYAHQAGVGHMMDDYGIPTYQGKLNRECVTIAEALKPAGYTTLMSGKWHVTPAVERREVEPTDKSNWPRQRGFDRFFGTIIGAGSFWDPACLTLENEPIKAEDTSFYYTTEIGKYASKFIEESPRDKPFFLYLPFTAAHWPLHAPEADIAKVQGRYDGGWDQTREERRNRMIEMGVIPESWELTPRDPRVPAWEDAAHKEWESRRMEVYAAMIEVMDRTIGQVVETIDGIGQLENTLILFLIDNGGCAETIGTEREKLAIYHPAETVDGRPVIIGDRPDDMPGQDDDYQSYGPPWANVSNTPFRYYKHWVHEGGISTPLIAHWPAGITTTGEWTDEPSHLIDIMATCVDVGGAEYPETHNGNEIVPLEGKSLAPLFEGEARDSHEAIYWEHEGNRAIRMGKWKLVSKWSAPENGRWELYDIDADRSELNDLADQMPEQVEEMSAKWQQWADRAGVVEWRSWEQG